jgi:hypothetical protein
MVWAILTHQIEWIGLDTKEEAIGRIRELRELVDIKIVNWLCASFPARVEMMARAGGETIGPLLSAHRKQVPEGYLSDRPHIVPPPPWTITEDATLLRIMEQCALPLTQVSALFPYRSAQSICGRSNILRTLRVGAKTASEGHNNILRAPAKPVYVAELAWFLIELHRNDCESHRTGSHFLVSV